jgi:hypothetical protein
MTKGAIVAVIIIFFIIVALTWWYLDNCMKTNERMIAKDCTAEAFNSLGGVTTWSCPAPEP